jgi:uncharacterized membrane protein
VSEPLVAGVVAPTHEDPTAREASAVIGGPAGRRSAGHPWWTPVRVVLALACVSWLLAMAQKAPCDAKEWTGDDVRYKLMCYSDIPYLYAGRGFAEQQVPFTDNGGRYIYLEYPVLTGYFAYGAALVTQVVAPGGDDVEERRSLPADQVGNLPGVQQERIDYFRITAVLLAPFALLAAYFLAGAHRRRPWDALPYVLAPTLVAAGLINWDLVPVALLAGGFWAWARGRPVLAGLMLGLGTAAKLYPLFVLGALLVVAIRRRQLRDFGLVVAGTLAAWLATNLPAIVDNYEGWKSFWTFNSGRGPDLGSIWLAFSQHGHTASAHTINVVSWVVFGGGCLAIFVLGLRVRHVPRVAQLAYLILMVFLLVNKVYSPQYVLWLLPVAVLAVPRWRPLLIWQAGELLYFAACWWMLGGITASATGGAPDPLYAVAIVLRMAAELYLGVVVVRDMLRPEHDVARTFPDDDPMCPPRMLATT